MPHAKLIERALPAENCLAATWFIDADNEAIRQRSRQVAGQGDSTAHATRLFRHVRDEIHYEFRAKLSRGEYRASGVLANGKGFCVQKAVLLCALLRAADVPAALVLCDLKDFTLPPRIRDALGTDTMFHHGLNAIHLEGRWLLADASLSPDVVERKRYRRVDFDGTDDALFPATTIDGTPHAEVVRFHGLYADVPFEQMMEAFMGAYANADLQALAKLGYRF